jgi:hypothetical protein
MNVPGFNARGSYASEMRRDGNFFWARLPEEGTRRRDLSAVM